MAQNFHVPITEFYSSWEQITKGENSSRIADRPKAYFGASVIDDDSGCRLSLVEENGPAFNAGLKAGDLVLRVDEREIKDIAAYGQGPGSRAEGFEQAIEHDTVLQPWLCGGPLVNLDGEAIGINIARAGRVTTYALSAKLAERLIEKLKSIPQSAAENNN